MKILVYIQNMEELWECQSVFPLKKGEIFSLDIYDGKILEEERWLEVVGKEEDIKTGMPKYNTKTVNVPWAK